jgi:hypothetical protein
MNEFDLAIVIFFALILFVVYKLLFPFSFSDISKTMSLRHAIRIIGLLPVIILISTGICYLLGRIQASPPSWKTVWMAFDVASGEILLTSIYLLLLIIFSALGELINILFGGGKAKKREGYATAFCFLILPIISTLTLHSSFFLNRLASMVFGQGVESYPTPTSPLICLFKKCELFAFWKTDISSIPIRISTSYENLSDMFFDFGIGIRFANLIALVFPILIVIFISLILERIVAWGLSKDEKPNNSNKTVNQVE